MKNLVLSKSLPLAALLLTVSVGAVMSAGAQPANSHSKNYEMALSEGINMADSPEVAGTEGAHPAFPKQQPKMVLEYVNQPPMVPHSIDGYQVTTNFNACLNCHSVQSSRNTGAARISPTHFLDAQGRTLGHVAPRRYFCLQCHVPQSNVAPIVKNEFKPVAGFGQ